VGRGVELDLFRATLDDALGGRGTTVFLEGEPGIGKTRLANEFAGLATSAGALDIRVRSEASMAAVPYLSLRQAFRRAEPKLERRVAEVASAAELAAVVSVIPDLTRFHPNESARAGDAGFVRDAFASLVARLSEDVPILLWFDDLHWCDRETIALVPSLGRAIRTARCIVLGTYRDDALGLEHPLPSVLHEMNRARTATRLHLTTLTPEETDELVQQMLPPPLASNFAAQYTSVRMAIPSS